MDSMSPELKPVCGSLHRLVLQKRLKKKGMVGKHLGIQCWLEALCLKEYLPLFQEFSGVEDLLGFTEAEIRDLGIKNCAHRAKLVTSLYCLRDKYQRSTGKRNSWCQSFNTPLSPSSTASESLSISFETLQENLHEELQGDPADLRSHNWYHGHITRPCSEQLVKTNGDFLIRDSISQPGDFVLTCGWHGVPMHFIINSKVLMVGSSKPKVTYFLEEEQFSSIQSLIDHYVTTGKPVTKASNVILKQPIARLLPLSYYDMKYVSPMNKTTGFHSSTPNASPKPSPFVTPTPTPPGSPNGRRHAPKRTGSQPLLCFDEPNNDPSPLPSSPLGRSDSVPMIHGSPVSPVTTPVNVMPPTPQGRHSRSGSEPILTPFNTNRTFNFLTVPDNTLNPASSESSLSKAPPPKPSRIPSIKTKQRPTIEIRNADLYSDDRDYSDLDQVLSTPSWIKADKKLEFTYHQNLKNGNTNSGIYDGQNGKNTSKGKFLCKTKFPLLDTNNENSIDEETSDHIYDATYLKSRKISIPDMNKYQRSFNLTAYTTTLLPEENKPLDASTIMTVRRLLLDNDPRKIALNLTKLDLDFIRIIDNVDLGVGVTSGLELITLPQGTLLRQDIIERAHSLQFFVAVLILSCNKTTERAQILSKWIQIATELKNTMGNLFSFVSIMEGITLKQVKRLSDTWLILRQNHTGSAMIFDKKLRATYQMLMEGSGTLPLQNVCIPNIFPVACLLERNVDTIMDMLVWEKNNSDSGLESLFVHLDTARIISSQFGLYKTCGQTIISEMKDDPEVQEIFKTEFHLRLLWGKKGSITESKDRYKIFDRILIALSNQKEAPGDDGTAV